MVGKFKDKILDNVITESMHIWAKLYHYVLVDKFMMSKYKEVSKKDMTKNLVMQTEADPIILIYHDCLFEKKVFYTKNIGI
ncbi:hypothetical protein C1645_815490 [Glomus cerebriforme]|uniref:Uncharacterized protein n=1 Tax=Glomus cerebriforme TaxID=658196 RepID=A0A397TN72_9GLOM|nr:hypothetical protein C1645_815490 [Glomus cerebriforme]